jgi:hypothetical protein
MGKLVLDIIGTNVQDFVENRPCYCAKAMSSYFDFRNLIRSF